MEKHKKASAPSSNWLLLHKQLPKSKASSSHTKHSAFAARKRRKIDHASPSPPPPESGEPHAFPRGAPRYEAHTAPTAPTAPIQDAKNGESVTQLRSMVLGEVEHPPAHQQPGKYLAVDCEMVGVGLDGAESALARVSLVNFHGVVLMDEFVRPRERVVDYRTQFSGIRPADMVNAKSFEEVQKTVADLLKDRILVGHAVHNDLKALLLSHPRPQTRDTQLLYHKHGLVRGRRPALRNLVQQELGIAIQAGEHSSVTDARATMALFRLHRRQWEKDVRPLPAPRAPAPAPTRARSESPARAESKKRARSAVDSDGEGSDGEDSDAPKPKPQSKSKADGKGKAKAKDGFPGGGRRGVSSGLSTVVKVVRPAGAAKGAKAKGKAKTGASGGKPKDEWWKDLGGRGGGGAKGGMRVAAG
ncbi:RNA exonuclease 4 [Trametes pubescens]|uniref:RNA exonuclease 4 n=1 Tax=Trametes pubescens TaxID=154538 RepID=A0A1M2W4G0_TRAPU|nr:RNA exonuclease 4 [Trametes pubescens]